MEVAGPLGTPLGLAQRKRRLDSLEAAHGAPLGPGPRLGPAPQDRTEEDWLSWAQPVTTILGSVDPGLCTQPQASHRNVNVASARVALPRLWGLESGEDG